MSSDRGLVASLAALLPTFLEHQRWFARSFEAKGSCPAVEVIQSEVLEPGWPRLVWLIIGCESDRYQVMVGLRPVAEAEAALCGQDTALIGPVAVDGVAAMAYDATADHELALGMARLAQVDEPFTRVRSVGAEQSNTSLVFDDRLILKLYRRVEMGLNPDVEVTMALDRVGFNHVAAPVGTWSRDGYDLALAQEFLNGGSDGWALALTSLRDFYQSDLAPEAAGGDFGSEARRLGNMTARMHLGLAKAFGVSELDRKSWLFEVRQGVGSLADLVPPGAGLTPATFTTVLDEAQDAIERGGTACRVHGDYHLGQVMRTEVGWFVLDFEGEPMRTLEERRAMRSPLRDVAGMLRSFHYAAVSALDGREHLVPLAAAWERRNRESFLRGYMSTPGIVELVASEPDDVLRVLTAFELGKAAYELAYEMAYRPGWAHIPLGALEQLAHPGGGS
ncbi:MAG: maltokinase N-terminal cap-like domain-containing protein [Acidimicrobiales bacterium]